MPGDPFKRAIAGQPLDLPAAAWNAFIDTAVGFRRQQRRQAAGAAGPGLDGGECYVLNSTGADVDRFAVLGVSGPLIVPADSPDGFAGRLALAGVAPTADHAGGPFVVTTEPVAAGAVGRAIVTGTTVCKLNVGDAAHRYADAAAGVGDALVTAASGPAQVLYKESGVGSGKWAVVRVGNRPPRAFVPVGVYVDGGVAGAGADPGPAADCSLTYTIKDLDTAETLATGLTPQRPRLTSTAYNTPADGSLGSAYLDAAGTWTLAEAYKEFPTQNDCGDDDGGEGE